MKTLLTMMLFVVTAVASYAEEITVSAAASLTNAFKDIAANYEKAHPETKILLNFGASGALLQQIANGAPVDLFASADQETMDRAAKANIIDAKTRKNFVRNHLVIIAPIESKLVINQLSDITNESIKRIAVGNPASVPVGNYTKNVLEDQQLWKSIEPKVIMTQNVRHSLDYVARGEVDVGFVYATDAAIMQDKVKVLMVVPLKVAIDYPLAKVTESTKNEAVQKFIDFILAPSGQETLKSYGFEQP